jgi:PAS domain S-box-containing protein
LVEDNPLDAELVLRELRRAGYEPDWRRVDTEADFLASLRPDLDLILSDYEMPQFNGLRAQVLLNQSGLEVPFIIVSGTIGEETAVQAMKEGAADYLLKDRLTRLGQAVGHALDKNRLRQERQRAEEARKLFRALVDRSNDAFEVIDPVTARFLDMSDRGCVDLGYSREEIMTRAVFDIDPMVTAASWPELMRKARQLGGLIIEGRHQRKDGTLFPVELNIRWVTLERDYVVTVVRNITERLSTEVALRESEERFRQLAENITEVFWIVDWATGGMLYVSAAYETIWGRTCASLYASPHDWVEAIHLDDRERVKEAFLTGAAEGKFNEIYRILQPDGTQRWIHDRGFPIRNKEGRVYRIAGIAADISRQRKLEDQMRQAQKMEAMGTLAGGIAHDFNNILAAMNGYTELAKMKARGNPAVQECLDTVLKAGARAVALVRQILTFSRQQEVQRKPIRLQEAVAEPLKLLRATIPATIEFDVTLDDRVPTVLADATQVHQIMMNLGTNAWHAMRDRPGQLTVKLEKFDVDAHLAGIHSQLHVGSYARLTVSDTGKGMDRVTMERIFEPFFTTKEPGEGTGLGLSVVHGIMQDHEGAITVYSEPGQGTVFHLYFPAHAGEASAGSHSPFVEVAGHGERILYVDDEEMLAQMGQKTLGQLGYAVEAQTSAAAALELVRTEPGRFDLVITDQNMPGITGVDLARELLQIRPGLPIILTTGYTANLTVEKVHALGIREMLVKPYTIQSLAMAVQRAVGAA